MEIREIRIRKFACWDRVRIAGLSPTLNVVHLQDGGTATDFGQFLHGMVEGFSPQKRRELQAGELVCGASEGEWTLSRQRYRGQRGQWKLTSPEASGRDSKSWQRVRGKASSDIAQLLLSLSADDASLLKPWQALERRPELMNWLLAGQDPRLERVCTTSLEDHGHVIAELVANRQQLLAGIAELRAEPPSADKHDAARQAKIADLTDELRDLRQQRQLLAVAQELSPARAERDALQKELAAFRGDPDVLRAVHEEYHQLEEERQDRESQLRELSGNGLPKNGGPLSDLQPELRQLLAEGDEVLQVTRNEGRGPSAKHQVAHADQRSFHQQKLVAEERLAATKLEYEQLRQRIAHEHEPRLDNGDVADATQSSSRIRRPSEPNTDTADRLAELERRRRWFREEANCLLRRRQLPGSRTLALAVLFCLSIACLFGALVLQMTSGQWALTCLGLGGTAAAGAMKLSLDRRLARSILRCQSRISQLDVEIQRLHAVNGSCISNTTSEHPEPKEASRAAQRLTESRRRVLEAEENLDSLLQRHGHPEPLSSSRAVNVGRTRPRELRSTNRQQPQHSKQVQRWIKRTRQVCRRADGVPAPRDVEVLLRRLEAIYRQARDQSHEQKSQTLRRTQIKAERAAIKRLRARQLELLTQAAVEDEFALSEQFSVAQQIPAKQRRLAKLLRELQLAQQGMVDGDDLAGLLDNYASNELASQLRSVNRRIDEAEQTMAKLRIATPRGDVGFSATAREIDRQRLLLAQGDARIRRAMQAAQRDAVLRRIAAEMQNRDHDAVGGWLVKLTGGQWTAMQFRHGHVQLIAADGQPWTLEQCDSDVRKIAWLALQLGASERLDPRDRLPMVVGGEWIVANRARAQRIIPALVDAATDGPQILVVLAADAAAARWMEFAVPVVAISRKPMLPPRALAA